MPLIPPAWDGAKTGPLDVPQADGVAHLASLWPNRDFAVLYGYLSEVVERRQVEDGGRVNGIRRLYLTWLLDEYIELTDGDILYWRKVPYDGGTLVWVDRTKRFRHGSRGRREKGYEIYLAGQLASTYLSGAPVGPSAWDPSNAGAAPYSAACGMTSGCTSP